MNNTDLGRIYAYLLRNRIVENKSIRRNVSREERDIAIMLRDADAHMRALLDEFLDGQGLMLKSFSDDVKGLPTGAVSFVLARKPDTNPPFFGTERMIARMQKAGGSDVSERDAKIWFVHIWFILMDILYTRRGCSPGELQDWVEKSFTKVVLVEAMRDYLNEDVRKIDPTTLATPTIHASLTSFKEGTVAQFCNSFLDLMMDARLIESISSDLYRPTLLFAFEVKLNYDRQLEPFLTTTAPFDGATAVLTREVTMEESSNGRNH
jgi:hypothetical protein